MNHEETELLSNHGESDSEFRTDVGRFVNRAKIYNFSLDERTGFSADIIHDTGNFQFSDDDFKLDVYANGNDADNEGYVCALLRIRLLEPLLVRFSSYYLTSFLSVIDVSGNKRFTQSRNMFVEHWKDNEYVDRCSFEKYISREILLGDPLELLPHNCLTLELEVNFTCTYHFKAMSYLTREEITVSLRRNTKGTYDLIKDSDARRHLCELSNVFNTLFKYTEYGIEFPDDECMIVDIVYHLIRGADTICIGDFDIYQICLFADKYNIPVVIDICRDLIKSIFYTKYYASYEDRSDITLEEILKTYSEGILSNSDLTLMRDHFKNILLNVKESAVWKDLRKPISKNNSELKWTCKTFEGGSSMEFKRVLLAEKHETEFNFYN